jgi:excisionase family DNA binding protein
MNIFAGSPSLSACEAARALGVSLGTIHCWSDLGYLQSHRSQAGQLRFTREDVEAFANSVERPQVGALGSRRAL